MTGKMQTAKRERGAVTIVEATFVFPVMLILLVMLVYIGNAYYIRANVDAAVAAAAVRGAQICADPLLESVEENRQITASELHLDPYRYLLGGMDTAETQIDRELQKELTGSASAFHSMKPKLSANSGFCKFNNYVLFSTFSVEVDYRVTLPIRFFGSDNVEVMRFTSRAEVAVNDATEFIRNTDMAIDYFEDSKIAKSIKSVFTKINEFMQAFAKK